MKGTFKKFFVYLFVILSLGSFFTGIFFLTKTNQSQENLPLGIGLLLGAVIFYWISSIIRDYKKFIIHSVLSLALFFLTLSIILYAFNSHANDIRTSVQPSIDYLAAEVIEDATQPMFNDVKSQELNVLVGKNPRVDTYYVKNLSVKEAEIITKQYDADLTPENEVAFAKYMVSAVYTELKKSNNENLPLPLDAFKEGTKNIGVDSSSLERLDFDSFSSKYNLDNSAYIKIVSYDEKYTKKINPKSLSNEDVLILWENLDLPDNISIESKRKILSLVIGMNADKIAEGSQDMPIPVASLGPMMPEYVKDLVTYDIFSNNTAVRADAIAKARHDCEAGQIHLENICGNISLTKYENLMAMVASEGDKTGNLPIDLKVISEKVGTEDKLEATVKEQSNYWVQTGIIAVVLFGLAFLLYMAFYRKEQDFYKLRGVKFISKVSSRQLFFYAVFTYAIYYLIFGDILVNFLTPILPAESVTYLGVIFTLPVILVIKDVFLSMIWITSMFFIIAFAIFIISHFNLKKKTSKPVSSK